jgi:hypothetical protein
MSEVGVIAILPFTNLDFADGGVHTSRGGVS